MASINPFQIISHEQYPAALEAFGRLGLPDPMPQQVHDVVRVKAGASRRSKVRRSF